MTYISYPHHCDPSDPRQASIFEAKDESNIDGDGDIGAGYDYVKFAAELEKRGWKFCPGLATDKSPAQPDQNATERQRWGGPSPWAGKDSRTDAQKRAQERERDQAVERVLNILAPEHDSVRYPIFEWGHETTPTDAEMRALTEKIVDACLPDELPRRPRRMVGRRMVEG